MIESSIFYDRRDNHCRQCQWWKGVCLKGHSLGSPEGCPIRKFAPVDGADYAPDKQTDQNAPKLVKGCCGQSDDMPPLSWAQVLFKFTMALVTWIREGLPMVSQAQHGERYETCKICPQFHRFYCKHCKCIAYLKTKLGTEVCPLDPPRWT